MRQKTIDNKLLIGRNEWCELPELNLPSIKAKIDTGAKTSALHAFNIEVVKEQSDDFVYFDVHPIQSNADVTLRSKARVIDRRTVTSSNGFKELRYVIATKLKIQHCIWDIELTLSNREPMQFRMLLGREALENRVLIDPSVECIHGRITKKSVRQKIEFIVLRSS